MSDKSRKMLLKNGTVNRAVGEVCTESQQVRVAFNQYPNVFEIKNNQMVEYAAYPGAWTYEVLSSFFTYHKLTPTWLDCNGNWGQLDTVTGLWTGAVALVSRKSLNGL